MKHVLLFVLCLLLGISCTFAHGADIEKKHLLTVATGGFSGVYYPVGNAIATLLSRELGIHVSVQSTSGSVENISLLDAGKAELAMIMADSANQAYNGTGAFNGNRPMHGLRAIASLYPNYVQIVATAKSGLTCVQDLAGKKVGVGARNSGVELNARFILDAYDLGYNDIEEEYLNHSKAVDHIRKGKLDAAFLTSGLPNPAIIDLSAYRKITILPLEYKKLAQRTRKHPYFAFGTIPASTYHQNKDVTTLTVANLLMTQKTMSNETAYKITKILFQHRDTLSLSHKAAKKITLKNATRDLPVPLHAGAKKYFKEVGVL